MVVKALMVFTSSTPQPVSKKLQPQQQNCWGFFTPLKLALYESLRLFARACIRRFHKQQSQIERAHAQ